MNHAKRLYQAAEQSNLALLNTIALKAVVDQATEGLTEWQDEYGRTALNITASMREWKCVEWLALMGADVNHCNRENGNTALHEAVLSNSARITTFKELLEGGAKMLVESPDGLTALDVVQRPPQRSTVLNLFRQYFTNDAAFDDFIRVKEKRIQSSEHVSMRRVIVLHRHTVQGNIRRFILLCPANRPTQIVKKWIDTIDLDPPTMSFTSPTFTVQFVRHLFTKHVRCGCPFMTSVEMPPAVASRIEDGRVHFWFQNGRNAKLFESTPESTPEPTSPPDLPEVVGLNDVISHFNGVFHDAVSDNVSGTSSGAPSRSRICTICYERPINSGFVHGTSVHCCACTVCADMIMKNSNATCPVCRETIQHVVTSFFI